MQRLGVLFGTLLILGFGIYAGYVLWANSVEEAPYTITETWDNNIEIRNYPGAVLAEVEVTAPFNKAGDKAFRTLFKYIDGANQENTDIEMTAPVVQSAETTSQNIGATAPAPTAQIKGQINGNKSWNIAFVLPQKYNLQTAPKPVDADVTLRETGPFNVAAIRFSGGWDQEHFAEKANELAQALKAEGIAYMPAPIIARYNPPFTPPFLRRNEVMYQLISTP